MDHVYSLRLPKLKGLPQQRRSYVSLHLRVMTRMVITILMDTRLLDMLIRSIQRFERNLEVAVLESHFLRGSLLSFNISACMNADQYCD